MVALPLLSSSQALNGDLQKLADEPALDDVEFWIDMARANSLVSEETQQRVRDRLVAMLDKIDEHSHVILSKRARKFLYSTLATDKWVDASLTLAAIRSLRHLGDSETLPHLRAVVSGAGFWNYHKEIREQAALVLHDLEEHLNAQAIQQTLLRSSSPSAASPDTLLRAADTDSGTTPPQELLRAGLSGQDN